MFVILLHQLVSYIIHHYTLVSCIDISNNTIS
jgi:hypothetical protein